jgi:hypothetical protein
MVKIALVILSASGIAFAAQAADIASARQPISALNSTASPTPAPHCLDGTILPHADQGTVQECEQGVWGKPIVVHALVAWGNSPR